MGLALLCIRQILCQPVSTSYIAMSSKDSLALPLAENDMQVYAVGKIGQFFRFLCSIVLGTTLFPIAFLFLPFFPHPSPSLTNTESKSIAGRNEHTSRRRGE